MRRTVIDVGGGAMARTFFQRSFPVRYDPLVWLPALAITMGFLGMEYLVHELHDVPTDIDLRPIARSLSQSFWEAFYIGGYLLYFAPLLLPAIRSEAGRLRRVLVGFAIQLLIGGLLLLTVPLVHVVPCLHVANAFFLFYVLGRTDRPLLARLGMMAAVALISLATLVTERHDWIDIVIGLVVGRIAYGIAFAKELWFLENPGPWAGISYELKDLYNLFLRNVREHWETTYTAGQWQFLKSINQRPRHYTIAGIIQDRFPKGARVLDVGCGYGTLYSLLGRQVEHYTGIDLAEAAVQECKSEFRDSKNCSFEIAAFEAYQPSQKFDVVVLNEILYYFPLKAVEQVFHRALGLLKDDNSILIISMNKNFKASWIWRKLSRVQLAEQGIRIKNLETGSYWTVNVYRLKPQEPAIDTGRLPPVLWPAIRNYPLRLQAILRLNDLAIRRKYAVRFAEGPDHGRYQALKFEQRRFDLMRSLLKNKSYKNVLEVGCAEGVFTRQLASVASHVVAMDVSLMALNRAKRLLQDRPNVEFVRSNIRDWIPDAETRFDLIVLSEVLYHLGERNDLLKTLGVTSASCLKPLLQNLVSLLSPKGQILLAHSHATDARASRESYRTLLQGFGLRLIREEDVPPTGEEGTDRCLVSLLEKP